MATDTAQPTRQVARHRVNRRIEMPREPVDVSQNFKVLREENDGVFLDVEFVNANGERVVGIYKRFGWGCPPKAAAEDLQRRMSQGFSTYSSPRRRKKAEL